MKRYGFILNVAVLAGILFLISTVSAQAYENSVTHVSFADPAGWAVESSNNDSVTLRPVSAEEKERDITYLKLEPGDDTWITDEEPITDLSQLSSYERNAATAAAGMDWRILDESDVTIGGVPGKQFTFSNILSLSTGAVTVKGRKVYYFDGGTLMVLSFHCIESKFDVYWPNVKTAFDTFKLK